MNIMLTVNLWFLIALCLLSLVIGLVVGGGRGNGSSRRFR